MFLNKLKKAIRRKKFILVFLFSTILMIMIILMFLFTPFNKKNNTNNFLNLDCKKDISISDFDWQNSTMYTIENDIFYSNSRGQILRVNIDTKEYCIYNEDNLIIVTANTKIYAKDKKNGNMADFKIYAKIVQQDKIEEKKLYESTQYISRGGKNEYVDFNTSSRWFTFLLSEKYVAFSIERNIIERALEPDNKKGGLIVWETENLKESYRDYTKIFKNGLLVDDVFILNEKYNLVTIIHLSDSTNVYFKDINTNQIEKPFLDKSSNNVILSIIDSGFYEIKKADLMTGNFIYNDSTIFSTNYIYNNIEKYIGFLDYNYSFDYLNGSFLFFSKNRNFGNSIIQIKDQEFKVIISEL